MRLINFLGMVIAFWIFLIVIIFLIVKAVAAEPLPIDYKLANAIYKAEGGENARYLYGIRSVPYKSPDDARDICLRTIHNQRERHKQHNCDRSFIECLAARYAPVGAKNDPKGLNKHWLKNVMFYLNLMANKEEIEAMVRKGLGQQMAGRSV